MAEAVQKISGDVSASTDVTVNTKGGSTTATLRKDLREQLGDLGDHLLGATVRLGGDLSALIMVPDRPGQGNVRVQRSGRNRFEVVLDDDGAAEDPLLDAFLRVKVAQFTAGQLDLTAPMSVDGWQERRARREAEAEARPAASGE
jgi:hypothetical protein